MRARPALAARLCAAQVAGAGQHGIEGEIARITRIVTRLGRGHAFYELHTLALDPPLYSVSAAFASMTPEQLLDFETPPAPSLFPEIGSRGLSRTLEEGFGWVEVQPGRYRYLAWCGPGIHVRIVVSEYLACEVSWD